jgi:hypothetical protein
MSDASGPAPLVGDVGPSRSEQVVPKSTASAKKEEKKKDWPRYRGVTYHRKNDKWIAQASVNGKSKYLGTHPTREKAARVYDAFVVSTYGPQAKTNFPQEEVDFSLLPRLRSYKKKRFMNFSMLGIPPMGGYAPPKKDPNHPKHPRNAYLIFASEQRKKMKECGLKCEGRGNMHKHFSEIWKQMSDLEKQKYIDLASADRDRFEQEMEHYEDPQAYAWMNTGPPMGAFPMMGLQDEPPKPPPMPEMNLHSFPASLLPPKGDDQIALPQGFLSMLPQDTNPIGSMTLPDPTMPLLITEKSKM